MDICSNKHEEICYEGRHCPICDLVSDHEDEIKEYEDSLRVAEQRIVELEEEIERLNEPFRVACRDALGREL